MRNSKQQSQSQSQSNETKSARQGNVKSTSGNKAMRGSKSNETSACNRSK